MRICDLGALVVRRGASGTDPVVDIGGPKPRALLGILALQGGRPTSAERLAEMVWPDRPVAAALPSLQTYVAKLRQILEPGRAARSPANVLVTSPAGYALQVGPDDIDSRRFTAQVQSIHTALARPTSGVPAIPAGMTAATARDLLARSTTALDLWRDIPFLDLPDDDLVLAERARLEGLRLIAVEDLALLRMAVGEDAPAADALLPLLPEHPVRESLWALTALALARAGRQSDALETIRRIRTALGDELGIDPGPVLQDVETAVLRQDDRLHWSTAPDGPVAPAIAAESGAADGASSTSGVPTTTSIAAAPDGPTAPRWPLVGRDDEIAALDGVLHRAAAGHPARALLVGEPGIGKSRLLGELADRARATGMTVLAATCSADTGAPPLWPWTQLLEQLDAALPGGPVLPPLIPDLVAGGVEPADEGTRFRWWEAVVQRLSDAAAQSPLVVVLDDVHWADPSTLSLLQHVVERLTAGRLALLLGRRPVPDPTPALARVGETLARHDTLRVDLSGLRPQDIRTLVRAVPRTVGAAADAAAHPTLVEQAADELWLRTNGNAFFVTELLRLSAQGGGRSDEIPASVGDVVRSRLGQLPPETRDTLVLAAVVGRRFDALLLSAVTGHDPGEVLEALESAVAAGLVTEIDAARYAFAHALVRDAVVSSLPLARRGRQHALVAEALEAGRTLDPGTARSEAARHWLSAGPLFTGRAWRAAAAAAADAVRLRAWDEAGSLLGDAITAAEMDPTATPQERYDLHMQRAEARRWQGDQHGLDESLLAAYATAAAQGDVERAARAAIGTIEAAVWLPRAFGTVEPRIVDALRHCLREIPSRESDLGCRVMLALASELYYAGAPQERAALVEQGMELARRLNDPDLLAWATVAAFQATWRPATRAARLALAQEGLAAAERSGDPRLRAILRYLLAAAASENGRIDLMWEQISRGREICEAHALMSPLVAFGWLTAPWLALQGHPDRAYELAAASTERMALTSMPHIAAAGASTALMLQMITDDIRPETVDAFVAMAEHSDLPMRTTVVWMLVRTGRIDDARRLVADRGIPPYQDTWMAVSLDAQIAEIAAALGDVDLAATVYRRLAPLAGTPAAAAGSVAIGPLDTYLALAAVATGERDLATTHADQARRWCEQWSIPLAAARLADLRDRYRF